MPRILSKSSSSINRRRIRVASKRRNASRRTRINKTFFGSALIMFLIIGCFAFYLYLSLQLVEANFSLKEKEQVLQDIEVESQALEIQVSSILSIKELRIIAEKLGLTKVEDVRYLEPEEDASLSLEKQK